MWKDDKNHIATVKDTIIITCQVEQRSFPGFQEISGLSMATPHFVWPGERDQPEWETVAEDVHTEGKGEPKTTERWSRGVVSLRDRRTVS